MDYYDHAYTENIVCPYCGYEFEDSWEFDGDESEIECDCGKTFDYTREKKVTYTTKRKTEDCDHKDNDGSKFCDHCGKYLEDK